MTADRIKEIQETTGLPNSLSVMNALLQVWVEVGREFQERTCDKCTHCDKSTLTQLKQAYCNKLQTGIKDYDKFYCAYWKE